MPDPQADPGSFRDPDSRVVQSEGAVYRGLSARGAEAWRAVSESEFFRRGVTSGIIVGTHEVERTVLSSVASAREFAAVLEHERLPFVSYPYEWCFSMLRDAAALHLELASEALDEGFTTKDGTAYNVQWRGPRPVFIDVGSFEPTSGGPWAGYRQFCQTFLYPLMVGAHLGVDFRPFLRGSIDGITPAQMRALMRGRARFRTGVVKHVVLHSAMASRFTERAEDTKRDLAEAGFSAELTRATLRNLAKVVRKLMARPGRSHWSAYRDISIYTDADQVAKQAFVRRAAKDHATGGLVFDLGCNDGMYARVAAEHAASVVAVDADPVVVDALYQDLRNEGHERILPLVVDLADPSPATGWRNRERPAFFDRARPDLVLALAVVHHLSIAGGVPLAEVVAWLRSFAVPVVLEFPDREDPFVERLLANKPPGTHDDYRLETLRMALDRDFSSAEAFPLPCGTRTLYLARP